MDNLIEKYPAQCHLVILRNCLLKCKMCHMWKCNDDPDTIPAQGWMDFIASLRNFAREKSEVLLVGGEPMMKKRITDLIRVTAENNFIPVMTTSGFLIDREKAGELIASGLQNLVLSIDSLNSKTHDYLRGIEGVYERVIKAIGYFTELSSELPRIHIVTTISALNLNELVDLVKWVDKHKRIHSIYFQALMQPFFSPPDENWYKKDEFSFLWPGNPEAVIAVIDDLARLKRNGYRIDNPFGQFEIFKSYFSFPDRFFKNSCDLGHNSFAVDSYGWIYLCFEMDPIGNIKEGDIKKIWFGRKAEEVRDKIKTCRKNCKQMINCFFEKNNSICPVINKDIKFLN